MNNKRKQIIGFPIGFIKTAPEGNVALSSYGLEIGFTENNIVGLSSYGMEIGFNENNIMGLSSFGMEIGFTEV